MVMTHEDFDAAAQNRVRVAAGIQAERKKHTTHRLNMDVGYLPPEYYDPPLLPVKPIEREEEDPPMPTKIAPATRHKELQKLMPQIIADLPVLKRSGTKHKYQLSINTVTRIIKDHDLDPGTLLPRVKALAVDPPPAEPAKPASTSEHDELSFLRGYRQAILDVLGAAGAKA